MKRKLARILCTLLMAVMLLGTVAHGEAETPFWDLLDTVSDSSELPDWTGEKVTLRLWYSHGTTWGTPPVISADDVVLKEIERVTGIVFDVDNSFDNNGVAISAKLPMLVASNDYPDLIYNGQSANMKELIDAGKLYDLTELFEEYCGQFTTKLPKDQFASFYEANHLYDGRQYTLPSGVSDGDFYTESPETFEYLDWERYKANLLTVMTIGNINGNNGIFVRDDILTALYPDAHTMTELEQIFIENGTFTREEIYDLPIANMDDFVKMLYDIQTYIVDNGLKAENGRDMDVTYGPAVGSDNWGWLKILPENIDGVVGETNYFTQFNVQTGKLELAYKMDYFVDEMKTLSQLVRDNIIAKDSLVDNGTVFDEKINNAHYAVVYMKQPPNTILEEAGKTYRYRPIWLDQTFRFDQQAPFLQAPIGQAFGIFKDSVKEEDLPQVLRCFNYLYSDVGAKMMQWGPESAGLYEEVDGKRVYKDEALYECMVNTVDNGMNVRYGLGEEQAKPPAASHAGEGLYPAVHAWRGRGGGGGCDRKCTAAARAQDGADSAV